MERRENGKSPKRTALMAALALVLVCALVVGIVAVAGASNVGRDNEVSGDLWADLDQEVHVISTKEELIRWAKNPNGEEFENKVIALGANITFNEGKNAADWAAAAPAEQWIPVESFNGTFDGRGFTVSGLYAATSGASGFFATLTNGAVIRNLSLKNSYFKGTTYVASLAGSFRSVTVTNVYSDAIVECNGPHGGGILGSQNKNNGQKTTATVSSCWFDGSLTLTGNYGSGILGNQNHNYAVITDCLNTGSVTAPNFAGGISVAVYEGALTATRCVNLGATYETNNTALGYALTKTVGSDSKAADGPVQYVNCYGKASAANVDIPDVRTSSVVDGAVTALADSFTAADLKPLSGYWKMDGSIPVPAYFASQSATEIPAGDPVEEFAPTVSVENAVGVAGGTVQVQVKLKSNPGISDLKLKLTYDASVLTLLSAENGVVLSGAGLGETGNPYEISWSTDADSQLNGALVTLTFRVASDAAEGEKAVIGVSYAEANNAAGKAVTLKSVDGAVEAVACKAGDVNMDNVIDGNDATLLLKYVAGENVEINLRAADVDRDMDVDASDASRLAAYVAGQNVTLG